MKIAELVNHCEVVVQPYDSINSIEKELVSNFYLIVKDNNRFMGILTLADVLISGHNLVVDCYSEKPLINGNEDAENVLKKMLNEKILVLPVIDDNGEYIGSVQLNMIFKQIWELTKSSVEINWTNVISNDETENRKHSFSMELFHNSRNPVQGILSSANMLRHSPGELEAEVLLKTIESNARILDSLITKLYEIHFNEHY